MYNKNKNIHENNICVALYIYLFDIKYNSSTDWNYNIAMVDVLNTIISENIYSELRTKEQLGYIVTSKIEIIGQVNNLSYYIKLVIQTGSKKSDFIINKINSFILSFNKYLLSLSDKIFDEFINGKKEQYIYFNNDIDDISEEYFNQIILNYKNFDYNEKLVDGYEMLNKKNIIDFYTNKFIKNKTGYYVILEKS